MPNHVTTRCTVTGPSDIVAEFRRRMIVTKTGEDGAREEYTTFDFDQIIPMPKCARDVSEDGASPNVIAILTGCEGIVQIWEGMRRFDKNDALGQWKGLFNYDRGEIEKRLEKWKPGCIERAREMARCLGETGFKSWYDWSIAKWGTKWGAYSFRPVSDEPLQFLFDTAWSFPTPIFQALTQEYPVLEFHCVTYDEGGNFAGKGSFGGTGDQFEMCDANDDLHQEVYGEPPERDEEGQGA